MPSADFVISELSKITNINVTNTTNGVMLICPFHKDSDPSCSVSLGGKVPAGIFKCFSCNASGSWNQLAEKLGLTTVDGKEDNLYVNPKLELFSPVMEDNLQLYPITKKWRKYSTKLLETLDVQLLWEENLKDYYLYFPVTYVGEYMGHIRAKIRNESLGYKYFFNLKHKLFYPYDTMMSYNTSTIVLVEGIADMLRLYRTGIPVLATLGTQFSEELALECLYGLMVKNIIFCYDGDEAGHKAVVKWAPFFEDQGFFVRSLFLPIKPKSLDPDNMPNVYVRLLKKMILKMHGSLFEENY